MLSSAEGSAQMVVTTKVVTTTKAVTRTAVVRTVVGIRRTGVTSPLR